MYFYDKYPLKSPIKYGIGREKIISKIIPKRGKVLDAGSGSGRTSILIHKLNPNLEITSIDISQRSLDGQPDYLIKRKADILNLPFQNETFDLVASIGCLHHTTNPKKGFNECARVLKKGSCIAIMIYDSLSLYRILYNITKHIPRRISSIIKNGLIQDAFFSPIASFHNTKEIMQWFKENNIKLIKRVKVLGSFTYYSGKKI